MRAYFDAYMKPLYFFVSRQEGILPVHKVKKYTEVESRMNLFHSSLRSFLAGIYCLYSKTVSSFGENILSKCSIVNHKLT